MLAGVELKRASVTCMRFTQGVINCIKLHGFFLLGMLADTHINDVSVIKILFADVMKYTNVLGGSYISLF